MTRLRRAKPRYNSISEGRASRRANEIAHGKVCPAEYRGLHVAICGCLYKGCGCDSTCRTICFLGLCHALQGHHQAAPSAIRGSGRPGCQPDVDYRRRRHDDRHGLRMDWGRHSRWRRSSRTQTARVCLRRARSSDLGGRAVRPEAGEREWGPIFAQREMLQLDGGASTVRTVSVARSRRPSSPPRRQVCKPRPAWPREVCPALACRQLHQHVRQGSVGPEPRNQTIKTVSAGEHIFRRRSRIIVTADAAI